MVYVCVCVLIKLSGFFFFLIVARNVLNDSKIYSVYGGRPEEPLGHGEL